jgi:hypothetical protein
MPTSTGWQPAARRPATTASLTIPPELRASLPTTTGPGPTYVPKAWAMAPVSWGVRLSPMIPRTPEMLILSEGGFFIG